MADRGTLPARAAIVANIILAGAGAVCLLVFFYYVYYYGWTDQRQFTSPLGLIIYYILPATLVVLLFASLRLKPANRMLLAASCLSLFVLAYAVEVLLYLSDPTLSASKRPIMAVAKEDKAFAARLSKQFGVEVDTRDQHEVIADLRKQGVDAVPQVILPLLERQKDNSITPAVVIDGVELMPLGGIANKVTVVCNQNGEYLTYKSDEHGFHNPGGIWQSGPVDVAAVGNSLTLGYCVPSDKNFVALIRERYPATLNLGMSGEGPLHILGILKEYASRLKPKLVLWFYPEGNSFSELRAEKQSRILVRYLEDDFGQGLPARQRDIDRALIDHVAQRGATSAAQPPRPASRASGLRQCIRLSALRQKLGVVYGTSGGRSEHLSALELSELKEELDLFRDIVSEAKARVAAWGGELYFVYLPSWGRLTNNLGIGDRARTQVLTLVDNLDIPLIDVSPAFQAHRDPLSLFPFRGPGHYNEEGHRVVAEVVLNVLTRRHPNDSGGRTSSGLMPEA